MTANTQLSSSSPTSAGFRGRVIQGWKEFAEQRPRFALQLASYFETASGMTEWENLRVLDVGCGDGAFSRCFSELGARVTALEYDFSRFQRMKEPEVNFARVAGDGHFLPYRSNTFDYVIVSDLLEHVRDPWQVMREVARVCKPHAKVYVSATNRTSLTVLVCDPHYALPGVSLMSKSIARWYVTRFAKVAESYRVEKYLTRGRLLRNLAISGFSCRQLPVYEERIRTREFTAPSEFGRAFAIRLLANSSVREAALRFSRTLLFNWLVGGVFHFMCERVADPTGAQ
jgi:2-polyprenyl-3-methyl-5-hydroxy-6-metoxy-1,4-benzoquinol methylase